MTKISNRKAYSNEDPISENDFVVGTDGDSEKKATKSFSFWNIREFVNAGLSPEVGGTLAITELTYVGVLTTPEEVVNQLVPNKTITAYEVFIVSVNGSKYICSIQDRVVGDTQPPTDASDYILLADGSETKIISSTNTSITGNGTIATPYVINLILPPATDSIKGILKLTNDLGGTADLPTTPTALHKTGDEIKNGKLTVTEIIKSGGLASEFLKANGSIDSNIYGIDANLIHKTGNEVKTGSLTVDSIIKSGGLSTEYLMANGTVSTIAIADTLFKYQVIEMDVDIAYINANFNMTPGPTMGLGKNLMLGLAICNGNNGTKNREKRVSVGYGSTAPYNVMGYVGGSEDSVLIDHDHNNNWGIVPGVNISGSGSYAVNANVRTSTLGTSETGIGKNMQPYIITLFVQKL